MSASYSALNMKRANSLLTKSLQRLSSGKRIVSPADDAGGLAVGLKLQSSMRRAAASMMNTQNGMSFLQMQDGAMKVAGEIVDRMAELKAFFNDISKNALDRETYNHEFHELQKELNSLKAQKFNGVSLFAMTEPDSNPLKIITSDDGLGEKIELSRTGFFENLKSKFGADGALNSGSHGSYRQLVGSFTEDGGVLDANPGHTSRAYSSGEVVFVQGATDASSGYFMALKDVSSGTAIADLYSSADGDGAHSQWIRLADKSGAGFAEAYPQAPLYNEFNSKVNSSGERVAYLKGDIIKVPAHWNGGSVYMEAQTDVPQGLTLSELFEDGNYIGASGYFDYIGSDKSNGGTDAKAKPTTEFVRANANFAEPEAWDGTDATTSAASLKSVMDSAGVTDNYTPGIIKDENGDIYEATHNWGAKTWNVNDPTIHYGDLIYDATGDTSGSGTEYVKQVGSQVQGTYTNSAYATGDYVQHQGKWFKASGAAASGEVPVDAASVASTAAVAGGAVNQGKSEFVEGDYITFNNAAGDDVVYKAGADIAGDLDLSTTSSIAWGKFVRSGGEWYQANALEVFTGGPTMARNNGRSDEWIATDDYAVNDVVQHNNQYWKTNGDPTVGDVPGVAGTWQLVVAADVLPAAAIDANGWTEAGVEGAAASTWKLVPWLAKTEDELMDDDDFAADVTATYSDLTNTSIWSKTHYKELDGRTVSTSYSSGDNIHYQGKNYVYVSHLPATDFRFTDPANDGETEFELLLEQGAIVELPMYVDTVGGGGGAGLPDGVYYRPNQNLEYVDRLPNSGTVRTNSIERRTDAPTPPGDEIYNSQDDQFYGGLNAGNDGIYGTMDDFYSTTAYSDTAKAGGHVDADADNNKDLLDTTKGLEDFSVADFVDYIQTIANFRAVNGGTQSRLGYATRILEENQINLQAATSRIMDADMAAESTKLAQQNVLIQAGASMVVQANQQASLVLSLLQ